MGKRRAWVVLPLVAGLSLAGCGGQAPAPPPSEPSPAAVAPAPRLDVDPGKFPPSRPPMAATPDLLNAVYAIDPATLDALARNRVPATVVEALRQLSGKRYDSAADFLAAARQAAGPDALDRTLDAVLRSVLVVTLAEPPVGPRGQASLDEAAAPGPVR